MKDIQTKRIIKAGDAIMKQGEDGDSAYIIEKGSVEITIETDDGSIQSVGRRGAGAIIGEMAIIDSGKRTATIQALEDCELIEITKDNFAHRVSNADPVLQMVVHVILTRYRDMVARAQIFGNSNLNPPPESLEIQGTQHEQALEMIKMANDFKDAISKNELDLHYQPIISLKQKQIVGFEALMRWTHPTKGFIPPDVFIPVAEDSGIIVEASKWAMERACRDLKRIEGFHKYPDPLFMSVNFSSRDFAEDDFLDTLLYICQKTDVQLEQIKLEITERLLIQQPDAAREILQSCSEAGLSIAIDDFGTGYSSLSYLHHFPIDTLKVDRSFISAMMQDKTSRALVKSIIQLAKNVNMSVVAEGVEQKEEGDMLLSLDCDMAQGYYYARPMPLTDLADFVRDWDKNQA